MGRVLGSLVPLETLRPQYSWWVIVKNHTRALLSSTKWGFALQRNQSGTVLTSPVYREEGMGEHDSCRGRIKSDFGVVRIAATRLKKKTGDLQMLYHYWYCNWSRPGFGLVLSIRPNRVSPHFLLYMTSNQVSPHYQGSLFGLILSTCQVLSSLHFADLWTFFRYYCGIYFTL